MVTGPFSSFRIRDSWSGWKNDLVIAQTYIHTHAHTQIFGENRFFATCSKKYGDVFIKHGIMERNEVHADVFNEKYILNYIHQIQTYVSDGTSWETAQKRFRDFEVYEILFR